MRSLCAEQPAPEAGVCAGRFERTQTDISISDVTGLALQDLTVARMLEQRAAATGIGTRIAWPW